MQKYKELNINNDTIQSYELMDFTKLINSPLYLSAMTQLLHSFSLDINPKFIYLSYLIYNFKSEIFYNTEPFIELLLFYKSKKITELFETLLISKESRDLEKQIVSFTSLFYKWKKIDASLLRISLKDSFEELNIIKTLKSSDESLLSSINTKQQFIKSKIEILQKTYGLSDNSSPLYNSQSIAEKAFWTLFTEALKRFESNTLTPQDIMWITDTLQEILTLLNSLTPNNPFILQENNDSIDILLIKQRIENNILDPSYLNSLVYFIVKRIQLLQSPSEDSDTLNWLSIITQLLDFPCHYYDFLPIFFEKVYSKIYKIKSQLNDLNLPLKPVKTQ
jgi:hypothetical protein